MSIWTSLWGRGCKLTHSSTSYVAHESFAIKLSRSGQTLWLNHYEQHIVGLGTSGPRINGKLGYFQVSPYLCETESSCETIQMKMCVTSTTIIIDIKLFS